MTDLEKLISQSFKAYIRAFFFLLITNLISISVSAEETIYKPSQKIPEEWLYASDYPAEFPSDDQWWKEFNDPLLCEIIKMAEKNNYNLAIALKRINLARTQLKQTKSSYSPQLDLGLGWTMTRSSGRTEKPYSLEPDDKYFTLQGNLNWEVDIFGRVASQVKAGKADVRGSRADYASAMISLCADVAINYFELITSKEQLKNASKHIATQEETIKLTEARHEAGLVSALDVAQAKSVAYSTKAAVPALRAKINSLRRAIATLCGVYESDLPPVTSPGVVPDCPPLPAVGVPADLIRRRADILSEEAKLASLAAKVGVSKKDFLPTLSLTGSFALQAGKIEEMFSKEAIFYNVAPTLSWTIFDGLARNYQVAEAKLQFEMELDSYNFAVMTAVQEVNDAIGTLSSVREQIDIDNQVIEFDRETMRLSLERYKLGLSDFNNLVNAQVALLTMENDLIVAKGSALTAMVNLYKALGGGWREVYEKTE